MTFADDIYQMGIIMKNEIFAPKGTAHIKKGEARLLKQGGAWIFDNEIESVEKDTGFENGDIVSVLDFDGYHLGYGYYNQNSKIRIRMLSRYRQEPLDTEFLTERVRTAWDYRKSTVDTSSCRVIFGEADFLPGIVVDKYGEALPEKSGTDHDHDNNECLLVVQSLALGIDRLKKTILEALIDCLAEDGVHVRGIYERSDAPVRKKEGMALYKGWIYTAKSGWAEDIDDGTSPLIYIMENGVRYLVDVENGQKTGFFLDQKYNRLAVQHLAKGRKVLDCFTHMGTFALNAGLGGAESVLGLDISEFAIEQARKNAELNGLSDTVRFETADVLDELPRLLSEGESYDLVILDPPAFTKAKEATKRAIKGYREINMKGMRLVRDGGYLATCSCSHFMTEDLFKKTIHEAAQSVHVRLRQVEFRTQAPDHPILWSADESYYLKFIIFQVVRER